MWKTNSIGTPSNFHNLCSSHNKKTAVNSRETEQQKTYIPHIATYLATANQELESSHPLVRAQPGLARKVVQVCDQPCHQVLEPRIGRLRVDPDRVGRDVVNG